MSESGKAVFLSYASQDASAARRICDALRAAGLDVWFDQNELRGGDAWDASIRRQIRECDLFVPIISENTQARAEGYFRREWKLAADRTLDMADDKAFLLPVVIDGTSDAGARIPEKFREVHWTRLLGGEAAEAFAQHARRLMTGGATPARVPVPPAARVVSGPAARPGAAAPSIAVLPFVNMTGDQENEYFADGLAEELLNVLAKIRGIRVASRTSAFHFKGKDVDVPTIARKLGVATVLEGSVRKSGSRVRITAQLIEVATDSHLWSETYDRELDDIFAVQDDIAHAVVKELRAALLGERPDAAASAAARAEVEAAAAGRTESAEAHRLLLQGRFFLDRMTREGVERGIGYFRQAVELDPGFALGWAGLARAHHLQAGFGWADLSEGFEKARHAALRALAIAPDLAEGHVALGHVLAGHDWKWKDADIEFQRALALAPGNAGVLRAVANLAGELGRLDEAAALARRAAALDPLSAPAQRHCGHWCIYAGRLDEGIAALNAALDLEPRSGLANALLCCARLLQGRADDALAAAEREVLPAWRSWGVAMAQHALGRAGESDTALQALIDGYGSNSAYQIAEVHAFRREADRAFEWLARARDERDPGLANVAVDPLLRSLHGDPRWSPFLREIGLA